MTHKRRLSDRQTSTRNHVKAVAQSLFAESGLKNVSTRQIIKAAGQKNLTVINYYFGSKDALIAELIDDVVKAAAIDRNSKLDALVARGGPKRIRQILEILATPLQSSGDDILRGTMQGSTRFIVMLWLHHRDEFLRAMNFSFDEGTRRCLRHLRRMMGKYPRSVAREKIGMVLLLITSILAADEAVRAHPPGLPNPFGHIPVRAALDAAELILLDQNRRR